MLLFKIYTFINNKHKSADSTTLSPKGDKEMIGFKNSITAVFLLKTIPFLIIPPYCYNKSVAKKAPTFTQEDTIVMF